MDKMDKMDNLDEPDENNPSVLFTRYDWLNLSYLWFLEKEDKDLLDRNEFYILSLKEFYEQLREPKDRSVAFQDRLELGKTGNFVVHYYMTSKDTLSDLMTRTPDLLLLINCRVNVKNKFYSVLVRKFNKHCVENTGARSLSNFGSSK